MAETIAKFLFILNNTHIYTSVFFLIGDKVNECRTIKDVD